MAAKDARIRLLTDIIYSMKQVKMQAWEYIFNERINVCRREELNELRKVKYLDAACVYFWATTPVLLSVILIGIYAYMGEEMTASKIFTALTLINMLIFPLNAYPWVINGTMEGWVSLNRLQALMDTNVIDYQQIYEKFDSESKTEDDMYGLNSKIQAAMKVENSNFSYSPATDLTLQSRVLSEINLKVGFADFIGIVGPVGSGKSSLVLSLLGELEKTDGTIYWNTPHDGIGYVSQDPWIFGGTVRENIIFGSHYNAEWYRQVIQACCLVTDIECWPGGDLTELGEGGATLSGGQKARINLARQVYQQRDIYLLDDIFAQLDKHVCAHIYENVVLGLLRDTTRILVTHQMCYIRDSRITVVMEGGKIETIGTPKDIGVEQNQKNNEEDQDEHLESEQPIMNKEGHSIIDEEERVEGKVSIGVYWYYVKMTGYSLSYLISLSLIIMQGIFFVSF